MNAGERSWWLTLGLVLLLVLGGAVFLHRVGIDALDGFNELQFFADSQTYHSFARGDLPRFNGLRDAIGVGSNLLGPLLILGLAGDNYYAVLAFNAVLFFVAVLAIARAAGVDPFHLALLLVVNPLTISSLLSINKEIIGLAFLAVLLNALRARSLPLLALAFVVALLVRWQLSLFVLVLAGCLLVAGRDGVRRAWCLVGAVLAFSVMYVAMAGVFSGVQNNFESAALDYQGSGVFTSMVEWQKLGLYWAVFPIKALHLMFALGLRLDRLLQPASMYNEVWQLLHSTALLALSVAALALGRLRLRNDLVFIAAVYLVVFVVTPIFAPRYLYPVYVLLAVALLRPRAAHALAPLAAAPKES